MTANENDQRIIDAVNAAQTGDPTALDRIAREIQPRIQSYIYRVTLNEDLAAELTQETQLAVVRALPQLKNPDRFFPWLFRIAQSKIQNHYRQSQRRREQVTDDIEAKLMDHCIDAPSCEGFDRIARRELAATLARAISKLKSNHRSVLSLRCFEELPYKEIARTMDCSEINVRVQFVRAKKALRKELSRHGLSHCSLLLALAVFAGATGFGAARASAAISASTLQAGAAANVIGAAITAKGIVTAAAVVGVAVGYNAFTEDGVILLDGVRSVHYTIQARSAGQTRNASLSGGAYEAWCCFPQGPDGPMLLRQQRWDPKVQSKLCSWLQNEHGNYYYHSGKNVVYMVNERVPGYFRQPTDAAEMAAFIDAQDLDSQHVRYEYHDVSGLPVSRVDDRFVDTKGFETSYEYNTLAAGELNAPWPEDAPIIDQRSELHKQGYAYFRITGRMGAHDVRGAGCVPLVLAAHDEHTPWVTIDVQDCFVLNDTATVAWVVEQSERPVAFASGAFFKGLLRPWLGLSAVENLRRAAAQHEIPSYVNITEDMSAAFVRLSRDGQNHTTTVTYTVDLDEDLVTQAVMTSLGTADAQQGFIRIEYGLTDEILPDGISRPAIPAQLPRKRMAAFDAHWLFALTAGDLTDHWTQTTLAVAR